MPITFTAFTPKISSIFSFSLPFVAPVVALILFGSGGGDDSHITWWVVDELRRTGHILNLNGAAVEQSSSLGLVLVAAALKVVIPVSTPALGVGISVAATAATCWMTGRVARRLNPAAALPAVALVATSAPLLYWGTSGMETSLAAFAAVWLLDSIGAILDAADVDAPKKRQSWIRIQLVVAASLFVAIRPENPLLLLGLASAGLCGGWLSKHLAGDGAKLSSIAVPLVLALAPVVVIFAWRRAVFREWFPNPVSAKSDGGMRWAAGWEYLLHHTVEFQPAMLVLLPAACTSVCFAFLFRKTKPLAGVIAILSALGVLFICSSGGDWMSCGRFIANQLPIWWLVVVLGLSSFTPKRPAIARLCFVILGLGNVYLLLGLTRSAGVNGYPAGAAFKVVPAARAKYDLGAYSFIELANKSHMRDALLATELNRVIEQLANVIPGKIWVASGQAGAVPYHVFRTFPGKLRFIDFWGLTSSDAVPCIPASKLRHSNLGVAMPLDLMFQYRESLLNHCGIPQPDVVFNTSLRRSTRQGLEAKGFRVVYFQRGKMLTRADDSDPRSAGRIDAYIAVRTDLAERLKIKYHEVRWAIAG